jgi:thiol-disulfide isomerase/thioredoxin
MMPTLPKIIAAMLLVPTISFCALIPIDETGFQKLVDSHKGKVVIYEFWATWCAPCRKDMPQLLRLEAKLRSRGFEVVTISADEPEQDAGAEKILKQLSVPGPSYRKQARNDDNFVNSIDRTWNGALPALFLYDRSARKIRSFIGDTELSVIEAAVLKLL